ncbi:MAG: putative signal transducing protein [Verrucomicrobiia bacterium]|jgi:hypothetical protein
MDFVTVYKTRNLADAELIKCRLEGAGIPAFVPEESSPLAVLGVRVQVADSRKDDALEVIGADKLPE